jgi:hypothetical protein
MKRLVRIILYCLLVLLMVTTFYFIFNAGNPHAIYRPLLPDPSWDITATLILAVIIGAISMFLFINRENDPIKLMLENNTLYIQKLRKQGWSEVKIADSFLKKLGAPQGFLYKIAKRKVIRLLSHISD